MIVFERSNIIWLYTERREIPIELLLAHFWVQLSDDAQQIENISTYFARLLLVWKNPSLPRLKSGSTYYHGYLVWFYGNFNLNQYVFAWVAAEMW